MFPLILEVIVGGTYYNPDERIVSTKGEHPKEGSKPP